MSSRILLIEDEPGLVLTLSDLLREEGYEVESATDGISGLRRASEESFDLLVLDVMLPGKNGLDVCRELRQQGRDVAILMLTAKTQVVDRVVGLRLGADDYLTKPFEPPELLARIEALLRRVRKGSLTPVVEFEFGNVSVDFEKGDVRKDGTRSAWRAKSCSCCATWWTTAARWFRATSCSKTSGNTSPASARARSMSTSPGCARSSKTTRNCRGTSTPCAASATASRRKPRRPASPIDPSMRAAAGARPAA